jgi:hypothetical protein
VWWAITPQNSSKVVIREIRVDPRSDSHLVDPPLLKWSCCFVYAVKELLEPDTAHLWWAGKELMRDKCLRDIVGKNEKTKVLSQVLSVTNYPALFVVYHRSLRTLVAACLWFYPVFGIRNFKDNRVVLKVSRIHVLVRRLAPLLTIYNLQGAFKWRWNPQLW